jgi:hypothetical protein
MAPLGGMAGSARHAPMTPCIVFNSTLWLIPVPESLLEFARV